MRILLLEDEESIRGFVRINLKRNDMEVIEAETGEAALELARTKGPVDIALLDVMLPTISGFEVCAQLRETYPRMGIIMLTAKSQEEDKIHGLELGADDYVQKPFSPGELIARIKSLHRRMGPEIVADWSPEPLTAEQSANQQQGEMSEDRQTDGLSAGQPGIQHSDGTPSGQSGAHQSDGRQPGHPGMYQSEGTLSGQPGMAQSDGGGQSGQPGMPQSDGRQPEQAGEVSSIRESAFYQSASIVGGQAGSYLGAGAANPSGASGQPHMWNGRETASSGGASSMQSGPVGDAGRPAATPTMQPYHPPLPADSLELYVPPFRLSIAERKLWKEQQDIILTPTEWTLVRLLMERVGQSVSRDHILSEVWGRYYVGDLKVVDVNIRRIRQKIEKNPSDPAFIETVWGYGYRWKRADNR